MAMAMRCDERMGSVPWWRWVETGQIVVFVFTDLNVFEERMSGCLGVCMSGRLYCLDLRVCPSQSDFSLYSTRGTVWSIRQQ